MPWIRISAEQDTSLDTFVELYNNKYKRVRFEALPDACPVCQQLNGKTWYLRTFINTTRHSAPIFSHVHVNARSPMVVFDPRGRKPDVKVYFDGQKHKEPEYYDNQDEEMLQEDSTEQALIKKLFE